MNEIKNYLAYQGEQYRNPDKAGDEKAKMLSLRKNNWGISLEVSFIERKKDEATLSKQAKVLDVPVVEGIYYWVQKNDESYRVQATEENRQLLRRQLSNQEIRKVLIKADVPVTDEESMDKVLEGLDRAFETLLPYYLATRN